MAKPSVGDYVTAAAVGLLNAFSAFFVSAWCGRMWRESGEASDDGSASLPWGTEMALESYIWMPIAILLITVGFGCVAVKKHSKAYLMMGIVLVTLCTAFIVWRVGMPSTRITFSVGG